METIIINAGTKQYPVMVGTGVIDNLQGFIKDRFPNITKILIITDETVGKLYLSQLSSLFSEREHTVKQVPSGEKAKTFEVYYDCLSFALEEKLDRKSLILSLGGGAVGDLAGFVASTFMRGIPFIQIPTTILAHDSAVGGKVGINHPLGKNMIGSFYQPEAVFYDLKFIDSLPEKEKRSGFAEVIKHALIHDISFYNWLKNEVTTLENISNGVLTSAISKGIKIKGNIVEQDEKEIGIRAYLNFGHTLGHAIEAEMGYGRITHGEAVMIGIRYALLLSERYQGLKFNHSEFSEWIELLGYQTSIPEDLSSERLLMRMKQDKKSVGQNVRMVLLQDIGHPVISEISDDALIKSLNQFL